MVRMYAAVAYSVELVFKHLSKLSLHHLHLNQSQLLFPALGLHGSEDDPVLAGADMRVELLNGVVNYQLQAILFLAVDCVTIHSS